MALRPGRSVLFGLVGLAALVFGSIRSISAHDVPNDVLIQAFLKPEGQRLRLAVRVPLIALRDMTWPFRHGDILDTSLAAPELHNAATLWLGDEADLYEGDRKLEPPRVVALRATLPTDRSFESYDQAVALITGPPPSDTEEISIREGFLDVLFEYPLGGARTRLSIEPRWGRLGVQALTRLVLLLPDGGARPFELHGDPGVVRLDPTLAQAAGLFFRFGLRHLLNGGDYLLFLVCLVVPFHRPRDLAFLLGAFAVAASLTLSVSALGMAPQALWFPSAVSTALAAATVLLAVDNIAGTSLDRRWRTTCALGLVFGFAFALALLQDAQLAGGHPFASLAAFAAGLAAAEALVVALAVAALRLLFRVNLPERAGIIVVSALIAHTAWHWMTTRWALTTQYQIAPPEMTPAFFAAALRWMMVAVAMVGLTWGMGLLRGSRQSAADYRLPTDDW